MVIIYPPTARFPVKIGEVTFVVTQLSYLQKLSINEFRKTIKGVDSVDAYRFTQRVLACSVKEVRGVARFDGPYELEFDGNGELTNECVDELMNLACINEAIQVVTQICFGEIVDPKLEGVEIDFANIVVPAKKSSAQTLTQ